MGGGYFGYKKEMTLEGDNKDGFKFIGSGLISNGSNIFIQSGRDVIFDGAQVSGDIVVKARGIIKDNKLKGTYKVTEKGVKTTCNKFDGNRCRCPSKIKVLGGCVGGPKCVSVYKKVPCIKDVTRDVEVMLNANFNGKKKFLANKMDLVFKQYKSQVGYKYSSPDFLRGMNSSHYELTDIDDEVDFADNYEFLCEDAGYFRSG